MFKFLDRVRIIDGFYKGQEGELVAVRSINYSSLVDEEGIERDMKYSVKIFIPAGKFKQTLVPIEVVCLSKHLQLVEDKEDYGDTVENKLKESKEDLVDINSKYGRTLKVGYRGKTWLAPIDSLIELKDK